MRRLSIAVALLAVYVASCSNSSTSKKSAGKEETKPSASSEPSAAASAAAPREIAIEELFTFPADDGKKLTEAEIKAYLDDPKNHEPIIPKAPFGLSPVAASIPSDNPMTRAKVELGRLLYFDTRLSRDETISCASCHGPAEGFADADQFSIGIEGKTGNRQAPTVMNRVFGKIQFWDGRAPTLEAQSLGPIQNPVEMGFTVSGAIERLKGIPGYKLFFEKVFGEVNDENLAKAIATYERTVLTGGSPNDYYTKAERFLKMTPDVIDSLDPDEKANVEKSIADYKAHPMSEAALRGRALYFGKAECSLCHVGENLTDEAFYNIGVGMEKKDYDVGRYAVTKKDEDRGAFKTPGLRNIAATAPYMHDGTQKTLMEVVDHYDKGGTPNPYQSKRIKKLNLSKQEKEDLVTFMKEGLNSAIFKHTAPRRP